MSNAAKKSAPASITKAEVTSNADAGKTANLVNGILRMTYYESILQAVSYTHLRAHET